MRISSATKASLAFFIIQPQISLNFKNTNLNLRQNHLKMSTVSLLINKGVEFMNIARILRNPEIVKSLPTSSAKCPIPMVS